MGDVEVDVEVEVEVEVNRKEAFEAFVDARQVQAKSAVAVDCSNTESKA